MPRVALQLISLLLITLLLGCNRKAPEPASPAAAKSGDASDQFLSLMNAGKNYLDQSDPTNAIVTYIKALSFAPTSADVHLNLAIAHLANDSADNAIREAEEVLKTEPNNAAAYFVIGSAQLRLRKFDEAVKALENTEKIDPGEPSTSFQLGMARMGLQQWEEAIAAFRDGLAMDSNRVHGAPHYLLSQALMRAGRQAEADEELKLHQASLAGGQPSLGPAMFEKGKFTQPRVPFKLEQPDAQGIKVAFTDATKEVLGAAAQNFSGPLAVIDLHRTGWNSIFALEKSNSFRLLWNSNGVLQPFGDSYPAAPGSKFRKMLTGDLQNDRYEDVIVLGDKGSHVFKFATNGLATDESKLGQLASLNAIDGVLIDLDFTGKLDLVAVTATNDLHLFRQLGPLRFRDVTSTSGIPANVVDVQSVQMADWNRDQIMDVIATRKNAAPLLLEKQRGAKLQPASPTNWLAGPVTISADFDNDLRADLAIVGETKITICFNGGDRKEISTGPGNIAKLLAVDYDNDGWLDLWVFGEKLRAWRNAGIAGFQEKTADLGLTQLSGPVSEIHFADFDMDCDSDAVVALASGGLRYLRNDGGSTNAQVKVRMFGNRSNASGLGCKIEIVSGGLRLIRTVESLPVEIGVGKHTMLDSFLVHWFNWPQGSAEVQFNCQEPLFALELTMQEGSCPYVYVWDGKKFRFITDILGAAPIGLPVAEGRYIESDPEELVWIGTEQSFPSRNGAHEIQITEELREVLYLDEAKLVVVDREPNTEVHSTDKLLPGKPFPPGALITLHNEHPLQKAETPDGRDVTTALRAIDGQRFSPPSLRGPHLRGLAEPHSIILDFGPLDISKPLALVLNGWLRFGGGMANIAASHDPTFPFPFPVLEAEVAGTWKPIEVTVGAPAGKTKSIVVDLEGKLPATSRRLRLTQAFEIHYDRIALLEKKPNAHTTITYVLPAEADLHFRGFSPLQNLPEDWPLTPNYDIVHTNWYWTVIPGGWCTRYGDVRELINTRDEGLALIHSGDELTLKFPVTSLPAKPAGAIREFFLYVDGWDKDSDFHVARGAEIGPLPFHGMNDQLYGSEPRPAVPSDALHKKYNTRWVDSRTLKQTAKR